MSVILTLEAKGWTQGFSGTVTIALTNSGTENIENIELKVTENVGVFNSLKVNTASGYLTCLNAFCNAFVRFNVIPRYSLAAGETKTTNTQPSVSSSAPVQVHNLTCNFQYATY